MTRHCIAVLAWLVFLGPLQVRADEEWTEFRGPTGQGHSTQMGLPASWSETENIRWKTPIPGRGWSSPIFHDGRVYLTTAVPLEDGAIGGDQSLRTLCLDADTGKVLWDREVFQQDGENTESIHKKNSHASPTPLTDGTHLYVHFGTNGTAALTLDGDIVWKNEGLRYVPRHGNGGSPILYRDMLILNCDGADIQFVTALDRETGKIRWQTDRPAIQTSRKFSFGTPLLIDVDGQLQLVSPGTDAVVAYDPDTGKEIWKVSYAGYSIVPRPVYVAGLVFICTGYDKASLLAIRPTGHGDVTDTHVAWSTDRNVPRTASLLAVDGHLYMVSDNGVLSYIQAETGTVDWQERVGGDFSASPLLADAKIYLQNEDGETVVILPGSDYEELARNRLNGATLASLAVAESALFLRTDSHLYRIEGE